MSEFTVGLCVIHHSANIVFHRGFLMWDITPTRSRLPSSEYCSQLIHFCNLFCKLFWETLLKRSQGAGFRVNRDALHCVSPSAYYVDKWFQINVTFSLPARGSFDNWKKKPRDFIYMFCDGTFAGSAVCAAARHQRDRHENIPGVSFSSATFFRWVVILYVWLNYEKLQKNIWDFWWASINGILRPID